MKEIKNLEPVELFGNFAEICKIPHPSFHTGKMAEYLCAFAEKNGLKYYRDDYDNVIIFKEAHKEYEKSEPVILQGHIDMVPAKNTEKTFDFETDSVPAFVEGDWIKTDGTTLGGDDGIAVAMILAVLEDKNLEHPPIEAVFTANEEVGMLGAAALDCSKLKAKRLINLDSEEEGKLICSCAGGADVRCTVPVKRTQVKGSLLSVTISGLTGGHSGLEIIRGRANSNVLAARLLFELSATGLKYNLVSLDGGSRENAIAAHTSLQILIAKADVDRTKSVITATFDKILNEYKTTDSEMTLKLDSGVDTEVEALDYEDSQCCADVLLSLPNGVVSMSNRIENLVQTSTNLGIVNLRRDEFYFVNSVRSSVASQSEWIINKLKAVVALAGGTVSVDGQYPGWNFNPESVLREIIIDIYKEMFGKPLQVEAVHAGMECGLFCGKIKNLDCVSLGPDMKNVHTPNEMLNIPSSVRTFNLLKGVLKELK